jgi:hypothetical protein
MMSKRTISRLLFPAVFLLAVSCNETEGDATGETKDDRASMDLNQEVVSAENVFVYVPSPIETASLLKTAGAKYDKDLLNSPQNISRYSTTASQALNLGIYGTDLAFAGIFDQHGETMVYMDCTARLADALHISSAFSPERRTRLENNMNNRDSVLSIITDSYWDCDALLHENRQQHASALMIAGGWIEGLYLACKVAEETNNNEIRVRIVEQRSSLDQLIILLEKQESAEVKPVLSGLQKLKATYDALPRPSAKSPVVTTDESGVTTIGEDAAATPASLNALEFKQILDQATAMRSAIVSGN